MRAGSLPRIAIALSVGAALASAAGAGELIRYRRADGTVGFAGDPSNIPDGAVVQTRRPTSKSSRLQVGSETVPSVTEIISAVREGCAAKWGHDRGMREHCISTKTLDGVRYRNMLLDHPAGSEGRALVARCRSQAGSGNTPDFSRIVECATKARSGFLARQGSDPASLDGTQSSDRSGGSSRQQDRPSPEARLQRLRDDQDRADRELEKGRRKWGPRYRKAERSLEQAESRTQSIVAHMRSRGCRTDTLACGGLGKKLANARRVEAEKRAYLTNGIVNECRMAGCQPGWLR